MGRIICVKMLSQNFLPSAIILTFYSELIYFVKVFRKAVASCQSKNAIFALYKHLEIPLLVCTGNLIWGIQNILFDFFAVWTSLSFRIRQHNAKVKVLGF